MAKVVISGSRTIFDMNLVETAIIQSKFEVTEVVEGEAEGVDTLAREWAKKNNIPFTPFKAKWNIYGKKRAGKIRNLEMLDYGDCLIAVWDGHSPGTRHIMEAAVSRKMPMHVLISKRHTS